VNDFPAVTVDASRTSAVRLLASIDAETTGSVLGGELLSEVTRVGGILRAPPARATCGAASIGRGDFILPVRVGPMVDLAAQRTYMDER
jgi:acyl-CoA hydrolase